MGGPHPAVAEIRRAVRISLTALDRGDRATGVESTGRAEGAERTVFVACSGGADSLALAAALAFEAPRAGRNAGLITIDHGLQPSSTDQAQRVAAIGVELNLDPVHLIRVEVDPLTPGGPEAAARAARYAALDAVACAKTGGPGPVILLGHTLDDQAETVLLGLGRGSGPRSIAGMRAATGPYLRPLLGVRRSTTRAACHALGLTPWDDPHNDDPKYQRVRLRHEVLPLLEDVLQGGVAEALARTATQLQQDLDALELAASVHPEVRKWPAPLNTEDIAPLAEAIRVRVLRDWLHSGGIAAGELSATHLAGVDRLITSWHGQGPIQLPGGFEVSRASGTLCIRGRDHRLEG